MFNDPRLNLIDVLKEQLTFEATVRATLLDDDDARAVLAIPKTEIELPSHPIFEHLRSTAAALSLGRPTTGPTPAHWAEIVTRNPDAEAWTYAMRFGKRSVWKIGHTQDVKGRLEKLISMCPMRNWGSNGSSRSNRDGSVRRMPMRWSSASWPHSRNCERKGRGSDAPNMSFNRHGPGVWQESDDGHQFACLPTFASNTARAKLRSTQACDFFTVSWTNHELRLCLPWVGEFFARARRRARSFRSSTVTPLRAPSVP